MKKCIILLTIFFSPLLMGGQEYIKLSHQISDPFVKDYSRRAGVRLIGSGGGMFNDIDLICLTFVGRYRLDLAAARRLFIDGMEDLLNRYNTNKDARPYLHNIPFTSSNLNFVLAFEDHPGKFPPSNFVADVFSSGENVCYAYHDPERDSLVKFYQESYEEAVKIVHAEREQEKRKGSGKAPMKTG